MTISITETPLNRTRAEIIAEIERLGNGYEDFFGVKRADLINYLSFQEATPFLKDEVVESDWKVLPFTVEAVKAEMIEYLDFAWNKANDQRGLSAERSINHFEAWLWLLNDGSLDQMENIAYRHYGKEKLIFVSELVGFDWQSVDDGERIS